MKDDEMGFGWADIKTEGARVEYPSGFEPRPPLTGWAARWAEIRKRLTNAWWALKGDSGW